MGKSKGGKKKQQQQRKEEEEEGDETVVSGELSEEVMEGDDSPVEYLEVDAGSSQEDVPTAVGEETIEVKSAAPVVEKEVSEEKVVTPEASQEAVQSTPAQREGLDDSQLTTPQTKVNPYSPPAASPLPSSSSEEPAMRDRLPESKETLVETPSSTAVVEGPPVDDQTRFKWKVHNTGYLQSSLRASLSTDYATIRSSDPTSAAAVVDKRTFDDSAKVKYPLQQLLGLAENLPAGVNPARREAYLSEEDFTAVFGKGRKDFYSMPVWKQRSAKKSAGIF